MHLILPLLALVSPALGWGSLGHRTVAYIASSHLTPLGLQLVTTLLNGEDISTAALWPDEFKRTPAGRGTDAWHYIDAHDAPPRACGVNYKRDCGGKTGCIVSALVDMTSRITDSRLSATEHAQALRFILHFLGDVHQPLHTEGAERGGNGIAVLFGGRNTNLHAVWDTEIPVKICGGVANDEAAQAAAWAERLSTLAGGVDADCVDIKTTEKCALVWASEANGYVCSYVLKENVVGTELAGKYYDGAAPIVESLIARAGMRLAAWINAVAEVRGKAVGRGEVFDEVVGDELMVPLVGASEKLEL
ncbi:MAG: hypothetical protein M1829_005060 [Trizodia sp. TS-e1964]|nr:MAG: hypothetical protein M1829_005060 [Trizodia sp. TS-e1964]